MNEFFMTWVLNHIGECEKVTVRTVDNMTFYEYHPDDDDRETAELYADSLNTVMVDNVALCLMKKFTERNPSYVRDHPDVCLTEEFLWAIGELESRGDLYIPDDTPEPKKPEQMKAVTEYHGEDGETYVIVQDERGYAAINKRDIQDGKVTRAYTGAEACASDSAEQTIKILRGRIYINGLKAQGLPEMECLKKSVEWWKNN